ncbi:hypothetical protein [Pseudomonas aeruginosa]|uniref:phosphoribosyltransferase-like protein n=1 Tax=Pseudomonas aeruginosa TaxID=287 RepID=UPI0018E2A2EA|nr:hypothetical protein [Pseudomonas aeruginosa]MBX5700366.1 hypothetical protein [Pseudomonas aeruginosa]MDU0680292.1 hypothetical protein [Pseudomonas aeruginosa]QQD35955.1 hypothetical protein HUF09_29075 [Pseudomonas aeruginosa]UJB87451.1 hypothetical protein HUK64_19145 [Pseudomonas aeruginosa]UJB95577.1 hypothetical protein HUK67_30640 [Pseudomonas aeruginosa]
MAFHVPDESYDLLADVLGRFRVLLKKQVITGLDEAQLDRWLGNFKTEEEQYFAACVLGRLIYRSNAMIDSAIDHLLHCTLPTYLRQHHLFPHDDIESFLTALSAQNRGYHIRFVGVDGSKDSDTGKSGALIIRRYKQHAGINKLSTCRPDKLNELPGHVSCLVFVDDMLGTGKQFEDFAKELGLAEKKGLRIFYCPLIAHAKGLERLRDTCPWLTVLPIEIFDERHQFFCESADSPGLWKVDESNTVEDARTFYDALALKHGLPATKKFGLDLLLGFEHSTPNNSLSLLWADSDTWTPLLTR